MQLARHARAFVQHQPEASAQRPQPQLPRAPHETQDRQHAGRGEPGRLVEVRQNREGENLLGRRSSGVGPQVEAVVTRSEVAVARRPPGAGGDPVAVHAVQPELVAHRLRSAQVDGRVAEDQAPVAGPKPHIVGRRQLGRQRPAVELRRVNLRQRRVRRRRGRSRIEQRQSPRGGEPQPAIGGHGAAAPGRVGGSALGAAQAVGEAEELRLHALRAALGEGVQAGPGHLTDAARRAEPQIARPVLQNAGDVVAEQPFGDAAAVEPALAAPRQTRAERADPQRAVAARANDAHRFVRQPVGGGVMMRLAVADLPQPRAGAGRPQRAVRHLGERHDVVVQRGPSAGDPHASIAS